MNSSCSFILIHSPLVGPLTWSLVAEQLRRRNADTFVPKLSDHPNLDIPYWSQHAQSIAEMMHDPSIGDPAILVAHSGAGPLLPAIRQAISQRIAVYIFVDAGIPSDGLSRLDLMTLESPAWAEQFRQFLEQGGSFPNWQDEELRELIPDARLRQAMLGELRPRGFAFFNEPIPVFQGWPDAPCGYIRFSSFYDVPYDEAQRREWVTRTFNAGHFHMLVEPAQVAEMLLEIVNQL
jgi:hypothetical protein